MAVSARDKKALLALLEQAQLVYLLTRLPKKQVLDDPKDVARLEDGLAAMRATARDLSASARRCCDNSVRCLRENPKPRSCSIRPRR
jgi:hypothetical protein